MLGNRGSRIASWMIRFLPASRCNALKRWLLRTVGGIQVGDHTTIVGGATFSGRYIKIGEHCHIGRNCFIMAPKPEAWITIGDWCSFGPEVFMTTGGHDGNISPDHDKNGFHMPITIEERTGVCVRCIISPGVKIGHHANIMPNVVVSKNIKPGSVVYTAACRSLAPED